MNGSKSPGSRTRSPGLTTTALDDITAKGTNGHPSPKAVAVKAKTELPPVRSIEEIGEAEHDAPAEQKSVPNLAASAAEDDAASEAETLVDSPVKKRELEKQRLQQQEQEQNVSKVEKPQRSRIGGLPVPHEDEEDVDFSASTRASTEKSPAARAEAKKEGVNGDRDVEMESERVERQSNSEPLSSVQSADEDSKSDDSSRSRAKSERPRKRHDIENSPNPRKRKHRASSASLPSSKRQSMEPPKRRLRGMLSEGFEGRSPSPKPQKHQRTMSTQSAVDGGGEGGSRKRKADSHFPARDLKSARPAWEESDASSETTSRGHDEHLRPKRGIGRSTSTPGRPGGREHKRHVNKYGFTKLAEACETNDLDLVKEWCEKDREQIELAEFAGNKPLQIAALNGNADIVSYLIDQGCQIDCANVDKDTPLIDAAENGHAEVVKLLLAAGVDPLRQNLKGQQALDVVTDETEEVAEIRTSLHGAIDAWNSNEAKQKREEEEEQRHRAGPSKELHFMARTYENLLRLVQINDRNGVREFLAARVPVDNNIIAAAAKTGDSYLVNMLLAEMTDKKAWQKPEKPMLSVLGTSHFEMVKALTELDQFNPLWRSRQGLSWPELAEERAGSMWRQEKELLQRLYDQRAVERTSSSPVAKREGGKRKAPPNQKSRPSLPHGSDHHDDDEASDEDVMPAKRKNGRRLMSKKDMRAAAGKTMDDSSDDIDDGGTATPALSEIAPETKTSEPSDARPSSKQNSPAAPPSPVERKPTPPKSTDQEGESAAAEKRKAEKEKEARFAIAEASRLEAKRREEAAAEADARRAEEEVRKAEEARREEERRQQAEAQERERVEAARQAEEEQRRKDADAQAARAHRAELVAALPMPLQHFLDPHSPFQYASPANRRQLLRCFTPLHCFAIEAPGFSGRWVMNYQIAPLLGKCGIELLAKPDSPGWPNNLVHDLSATDEALAQPIASLASDFVRELHRRFPVVPGDDDDDFAAELERMSQRTRALESSQAALASAGSPASPLHLRAVRLDDVRKHLHPLLQDASIPIEYAWWVPHGASKEAWGAWKAAGGVALGDPGRAWDARHAAFPPDTAEQRDRDREEGWVLRGRRPQPGRWETVVVVDEK